MKTADPREASIRYTPRLVACSVVARPCSGGAALCPLPGPQFRVLSVIYSTRDGTPVAVSTFSHN